MANNALTSTPPPLANMTSGLAKTIMTNDLDDYIMPPTPIAFPEHSWRTVAAITTEARLQRLGDYYDIIGALLVVLFLSRFSEPVFEWVRGLTTSSTLAAKQELATLRKGFDALKKENAVFQKKIEVLEVMCSEEKTRKEHLEQKLGKEKESNTLALKKARERMEVVLEGKEASDRAILEKRITELEEELSEAKKRLMCAQKARTRISKRSARDVVDTVSVMEVVENITNGTEGEEDFLEKAKSATVEFSHMKKSSYLARYCLICLGEFLSKVREVVMMSKHVEEMERIARVPGVVCVALEKGKDVKEGRYIDISDPRLAEWTIQACRNADGLDVIWCREGFPSPSSSLADMEDDDEN